VVDREAAARVGVTMQAIDSTLNDAFGQRQVSTIYAPLNQYRVVLEASQTDDPDAFEPVHVLSTSGRLVALKMLARWGSAPGALLALSACGMELSIMAFIGIFLLIGIVKKNAIMMIDFALQTEREHGLSSRDAIFEACKLRLRPILMTTAAALLGALPLALGT